MMNEELLKRLSSQQPVIVHNRKFDGLKPVVPQFVADWYEEHKDDFERNIFELCVEFHNCRLDNPKLRSWFQNTQNKGIQTLVNMYQFGYEVEKGKRYTVEIPSPNEQLCNHYVLYRNMAGKVIIQRFHDTHWETFSDCKLTESEIKRDFEWAWEFAKEVKE